MEIKVLVATHKKYLMPSYKCYIPVHVGKKGKESIGYIGDDTGVNISEKNPYFCELTGMYWGIKNLKCDYIGLVHYRRHFAESGLGHIFSKDKFNYILSESSMKSIFKDYDIILPKKRCYYIENLYDHYSHTHYSIHLDETRNIIAEYHSDYLNTFDHIMQRKSAHMFNMFIMKKSLANEYCDWIFSILHELEKRININEYDPFQARLFGRISELLLNVWIEKNNFKYKEVPYMHMERVDWLKKGKAFLNAKFNGVKFTGSF
ncbi:DUF4422 domain-containing protein [Clostridium perfringens]|uniref:DUF4422 domain-containing protein n=1 Tax=Clostridium perfringens TaxID=1502 RepID=UPI002147540F|nr:DUF4422 domain-containing protein [Clostridium perfringens]MDM0818954.1 DUF4422 domain-containing protein [Clostridium perfringens]UUR81529.1 DUF4422 domain-containing protein [Clostridium perfringens]